MLKCVVNAGEWCWRCLLDRRGYGGTLTSPWGPGSAKCFGQERAHSVPVGVIAQLSFCHVGLCLS